jgi:hypothetical protein
VNIPAEQQTAFAQDLVVLDTRASVVSLNCRIFSLAPVLRGEGWGEGLFELDNPFQKIPSG